MYSLYIYIYIYIYILTWYLPKYKETKKIVQAREKPESKKGNEKQNVEMGFYYFILNLGIKKKYEITTDY